MSYRCEACGQAVESGRAMLRHVVYRVLPPLGPKTAPRREVAREVAVCVHCARELGGGATLAELQRRRRDAAEEQQQSQVLVKISRPPI